MNADYYPGTSLDNVDNIIQFLMEEKPTQTTPNISKFLTSIEHAENTQNSRPTMRGLYGQTTPPVTATEKKTSSIHTNHLVDTSMFQPQRTIPCSVLTDFTSKMNNSISLHTNSSASHPLCYQQQISVHPDNSLYQRHKGLTNSMHAGTMLPFYISFQPVLPLELHKRTRVSNSRDRRKVKTGSTHHYHLWKRRNNAAHY